MNTTCSNWNFQIEVLRADEKRVLQYFCEPKEVKLEDIFADIDLILTKFEAAVKVFRH